MGNSPNSMVLSLVDNFKKGYRTPPLTKQLRDILDQYPDDCQILKVHKLEASSNLPIIL